MIDASLVDLRLIRLIESLRGTDFDVFAASIISFYSAFNIPYKGCPLDRMLWIQEYDRWRAKREFKGFDIQINTQAEPYANIYLTSLIANFDHSNPLDHVLKIAPGYCSKGTPFYTQFCRYIDPHNKGMNLIFVADHLLRRASEFAVQSL